MSTKYNEHAFEVEKNRKATLYTIIICGMILMVAIIYTWPLQLAAIPKVQDLIEINLGNEMEGLGDVQPLVPGDKAPDNQSMSGEVSSVPSNESPSRQITADEEGEEEAAPVVSTPRPNPTAKEINKESSSKLTKKVNPSPIVNPKPTPPKPKHLYKGGTGTGGNNADQDNGYRNQGMGTGNGDAGSPDGKPDSYGNSPGGRSGFSIVRGLSGRRPIKFPNMEDDFNENAKVYVEILVNSAGKVTKATIARGTTTANANTRNIAIEKAFGLKFPKSETALEKGTILFNFKLHN